MRYHHYTTPPFFHPGGQLFARPPISSATQNGRGPKLINLLSMNLNHFRRTAAGRQERCRENDYQILRIKLCSKQLPCLCKVRPVNRIQTVHSIHLPTPFHRLRRNKITPLLFSLNKAQRMRLPPCIVRRSTRWAESEGCMSIDRNQCS